MDKKKPSAHGHIPTQILVENSDIMSPYITEMYNDAKSDAVFPSSIKCAVISPAHKKEERTIANNYRPVSILLPISINIDIYINFLIFFFSFFPSAQTYFLLFI